MKFTDARGIEDTVWAMRLAEFQRGADRARIDSLANGNPPYSQEEAQRNNITINSSNLSLTRLAHDARQQLNNGLMKPGNFFTLRSDFGVVHRRAERGVTVTKEINRILKSSLVYYETLRSKLASDVLHGIGISCWDGKERWCPDPIAVCDVYIPSGTLLTFRNLPFFAMFRAYTPAELWRLTHGPKVDKAWDVPVVEKAVRWAEQETRRMMGNRWPEYWSPEKLQERMKEDGGYYAADSVQTIDVLDFYYFDDSSDEEGFRRKMIFDAWGGYSTYQGGTLPDKNLIGERGQFLYDSGDRVYASKLSSIAHWQFADLSAVSPFRYHTVRSLGWMLYSVCHLQNRLQCKFSEAVFENLLMYMRIKSSDDAERALKIELASHGLIDESVSFLSPDERWQPNYQLAELGLNEFKQIIQDNSQAFAQNQNYSRDRVEKTAFQVRAEVQAMTTLISAALQQVYKYQTGEYQEIFRRFLIPNSRDAEVREFRARVLARGVPEKMLVVEAWDLEPERVLGAGNKTLEMAIAQQLMEWRTAFGPAAQQTILRQATLSVTDDAALAKELVPDAGEKVSDARHDAMLAFGSLMAGARVQWGDDQNAIEIVETLLGEMTLKVTRLLKAGGMATEADVQGLQNVAFHVNELIEQIGQDKAQRERSKSYGQALGRLMNEVKGFAQRLEEQKKAQVENGDITPETRAKVAAMMLTAQAKAANTRSSHAERTAQRQAQHELEQQRDEQAHQLELRREIERQQVEDAATDLRTAAEIKRETARAKAEAAAKPKEPSNE